MLTALCMRKFAGVAALTLCLSTPVFAGEIRDATGRTLNVATPVQRVAVAGPPAEILMYVLAPDLMMGWMHQAPPSPFISDEAKKLPVVGDIPAFGDFIEISGVLKASPPPQFIIDYGDIDERYVTKAKTVQDKTRIPYAVMDGAIDKIPEVLRAMGKVLGREQRAEELAAYADDVLARAAKVAAAHKNKPVSVYVARSIDGTSTPLATFHTGDIYEFAGLRNVADARGVSPQQVAEWNPDYVIAAEGRFRERTEGDAWQAVPAIRNHRLIASPRGPWGWLDHPPSVNRLIGLLWLQAVMYGSPTWPELQAETAKFYKLFYGADVKPDQVANLLAGPQPEKKP